MKSQVAGLLEGFESDIVNDVHSFSARFSRSEAQKKLVKLGRTVLKPIAEHLKNRAPFTEIETSMDLPFAWAYLLNQIGIGLGKSELDEAPQKLADLNGWREWAEKHQEAA